MLECPSEQSKIRVFPPGNTTISCIESILHSWGRAYAFSEWVNMQLVYPSDMRMWGREGSVVHTFSIEEDFRILDVKTVLSSGHESFDCEGLIITALAPWHGERNASEG